MVGALGLEPRTSALSERRSSQLSYAPGPVATFGSLRSEHRGSRTGPGAQATGPADRPELDTTTAAGGQRARPGASTRPVGTPAGPRRDERRPPAADPDAVRRAARRRRGAQARSAPAARAGVRSRSGPETKRARGRRRRPRARKKRPALTYFPVFDSIIGPAGLTAEFGMGSGGTPRV